MHSRKATRSKSKTALVASTLERRILFLRGHKVILDTDLAQLYNVEVKALNKAVKRNLDRFPGDFMFQLASGDMQGLRFQIGTSKEEEQSPTGRGGRRYLPYAFTQEGVAMLSSVLRSKRATEVNIAIMRAFVRLREVLASHNELAQKLAELERKYDRHFRAVFDAIRQLMKPPAPAPRRIGFVHNGKPPASARVS